ncbi:MAG: c-type cytochrome [Gemmatimonadaceae bacterium]
MNAQRAALVICAAVAACVRPAPGREQRDFERMRQQQRYDSYEQSSFFANGAVMQPPPAHTVPRDADDPWSGRVETPAFLTGADGGHDVGAPPITLDAATLASGAKQFSISCVPCHGAGGYGGGSIAANLRAKRPPSLRVPPVSTLPAGTIFKVIVDGFGHMQPHGWQMTTTTTWAVVSYVRALGSLAPTADTRADSTQAAYLDRLDAARTLSARLAVPLPNGQRPR